MTSRYMTFAWQSQDAETKATANQLCRQLQQHDHRWQVIYRSDGLLVLTISTGLASEQKAFNCYPLANNRGVVLGKLFGKDYINDYQVDEYTNAPPVLDELVSRQIVDSQCQYLLDQYWGSYIAFIHDEESRASMIFRDPSGGQQCFYCCFRGVEIFFSDLDDCRVFKDLSFSINWRYITAFLRFSYPQNYLTGLNEVSVLLPGECALICEDRIQYVLLWDPVSIAQSKDRMTDDPAAAAAELRRITMGCINGWSNSYDKPVHLLSGGLDSSIVLSSLERANRAKQKVYLHCISGARHDNELIYARQGAEYHDVELLERTMPLMSMDLEAASKLPFTPCPIDYQHMLNVTQFHYQLAKSVGGDVFFSGNGGDELFFSPPVYLGAVDFAYDNGVRPSLLKAALNSAQLSNRSIWSVLQLILGDRLYYKRVHPFSPFNDIPQDTLMTDDYFHGVSIRDIQHPVLNSLFDDQGQADNALPPGKIFHLFMLLQPQSLKYVGLGTQYPYTQWHDPLWSQPLIEFCLKMPVYRLQHHGVSRGLARKAFARDLPDTIIHRQSKGTGEGYQAINFNKNIKVYKEALLDGRLVNEQILDRKVLEQSLAGNNQTHASMNMAKLSVCLNLETWLKKWS